MMNKKVEKAKQPTAFLRLALLLSLRATAAEGSLLTLHHEHDGRRTVARGHELPHRLRELGAVVPAVQAGSEEGVLKHLFSNSSFFFHLLGLTK